MKFKGTRVTGEDISFSRGSWQSKPMATRVFMVLAGLCMGLGLNSLVLGFFGKSALLLSIAAFLGISAYKLAKTKELVIINRLSGKLQMLGRKQSVHSVSGAHSVLLEYEGEPGSRKGYGLFIELANGDKLLVGARKSRISLHNIAEAVAKHLALPLIDLSTGVEIARPPDRLDESVGERIRRRGLKLSLPNPPADLSCEYEKSSRSHRFSISAPGLTGAYLFFLILGLVLTALLFQFFIAPAFESDEATGLMFIGLPLILLVLYYVLDVIQGATCHEMVVVSKNELVDHRRSYLGNWTEAIPASQIEELHVVLSRAEGGSLWSFQDVLSALSTKWELLARSDKLTMHLGRQLPKEQIEWMLNVIEYVLST